MRPRPSPPSVSGGVGTFLRLGGFDFKCVLNFLPVSPGAYPPFQRQKGDRSSLTATLEILKKSE